MPETHGAPLASSPEVLRRLVGGRLLIAALAALALLAALYITGSIGSDAVSGGDPGPRAVLLIADLRGQALVVVDLERAGSPTRIAVPGGPHELVLLDDGRAVTSLEQQGALAVVDLDEGSVEIIEVGGLPHGLAVSDGLLYVTDRSIGAVRRLRVDGWSELSPLPAGAAPHAVRALPGGELVIVSAGDDAVRIGDRLLRVSALPETVALSNYAIERVADAVLVVPPFYFKDITAQGLSDYYGALLSALPAKRTVLLYNIPDVSGVEISDALVDDLVERFPDRLLGIKDTSGKLERTQRYQQRYPQLAIYNGNDSNTAGAVTSGVAGAVSAIANVFPDLVADVFHAHDAGGDIAAAQAKLDRAKEMLGDLPSHSALKHLLHLVAGLPLTHVRPPLRDLTPDEAEVLARRVQELGFG